VLEFYYFFESPTTTVFYGLFFSYLSVSPLFIKAYITMSSYGGRCVVAAQDIDEGELIVAGEEALVHAVNDQSTTLCCHETYAPLDLEDEEDEVILTEGNKDSIPVYANQEAKEAAVASGSHAVDVKWYGQYDKASGLNSERESNESAPLRMLLKILALRDGDEAQRARYAELQDMCTGIESMPKASKRPLTLKSTTQLASIPILIGSSLCFSN